MDCNKSTLLSARQNQTKTIRDENSAHHPTKLNTDWYTPLPIIRKQSSQKHENSAFQYCYCQIPPHEKSIYLMRTPRSPEKPLELIPISFRRLSRFFSMSWMCDCPLHSSTIICRTVVSTGLLTNMCIPNAKQEFWSVSGALADMPTNKGAWWERKSLSFERHFWKASSIWGPVIFGCNQYKNENNANSNRAWTYHIEISQYHSECFLFQ